MYVLYLLDSSLGRMPTPEIRHQPSQTLQRLSANLTSSDSTRPLPSTPAEYTEIIEPCVHSYSNAKRCLDGYVLPQCEHCGLQQAAEQRET